LRKAFGWVGLLEVPGLLAVGLIGNSITILLGFWQRHVYGANLSSHDWFPPVQDIFDRASGGTRKASLEREQGPNLGRQYDRDHQAKLKEKMNSNVSVGRILLEDSDPAQAMAVEWPWSEVRDRLLPHQGLHTYGCEALRIAEDCYERLLNKMVRKGAVRVLRLRPRASIWVSAALEDLRGDAFSVDPEQRPADAVSISLQ
jgi:hypothetical protein